MKPKKRKINKKMIIMNIIILVAALFCVTYVTAVGGVYELHREIGSVEFTEAVDVKVRLSEDNVVEYKGHYSDDRSRVFVFKALDSGSVYGDIHYTLRNADGDEYETVLKIAFSVSSSGVIFSTYGGFDFSGSQLVIWTFIGILAVILVFMIWSFIDYYRKGDFCYQMIACGGVSIFLFVALAFGVYKILNNVVNNFGNFIGVIADVSTMLLLGLTPVLLVFAVFLSVSNIWLLRNEGYRPVNALGIAFGIIWAIGTLLTLGASYLPFSNQFFTNKLRPALTYLICYFGCMFISTAVSSFLATKYKPPYDRDYIIILGCAICSDGSLTPLLRARADSAVEFEKRQFSSTGKHAVFVPSGGQGDDEVISEAEAMKRYLLSVGIPEERIIKEDKSVNTMQNMQFSRDRIAEATDDFDSKKIAFATTNYHVFRGYILAGKNGFEAKGISAKTKPYFYLNAFLREFIGLLVDQKFKHLIFIAIILLLFMGLFRGGSFY